MATPGIIVSSKFIECSAKEFNSYIDYIDRKEAIRNNAYNRYSLYNDYMGNPTKTTGLFNNDVDFMNEKDKENSKELFAKAQENKSIMWQDVYSFDNKWLIKQGLYNPITKVLDEEKIKRAVRKSTNYILEKDGLKDSCIWNGAIHYNTDNIHIHVAICEPNPTTKRGKRTQKTLDNMKSIFANELLNDKELYKEINKNIREDIIKPKKDFSSFNDKKMKKLLLKAVKNLPKDKRHWHYEYSTMSKSNMYIDEMTKHYINTYRKDEFDTFIKNLEKQEEIFREIYGVGSRKKYKDYKQNKIDELYKRMGNTILKEIKDYVREEELKKYESDKSKGFNFKINFSKSDLNKIKKAISNDLDSYKNMNYYEQLQRSIDNGIEL
ncbi:MobP2 family relaxase [uncultured Tyzzerella sp.]|uniref:MobP2 family relaxase n=1 Tax=uncultured Tyzzerella sp. TaxID=2321398 RepID=UPI002941FC31|nr:MobP2 family relaxase [uncultured Tyzzerella sp.]